jgi:hypothetical protein
MANTGRVAVAGAVCQSPMLVEIDMAVTIGTPPPARNAGPVDTIAEQWLPLY